MTKIVGYTREFYAGVGIADDIRALRHAGAKAVFTDPASTDPRDRPGLHRALATVADGGMLIVPSASHLSHSLSHFTSTQAELARRSIRFLSLAEPALSTESPADPDEVFIALEALRRRLIGVRTRQGMDAAAAHGRHAGRPTVMTDDRVEIALELRKQDRSFAHIARVLGVSTSAVQRALTAKN